MGNYEQTPVEILGPLVTLPGLSFSSGEASKQAVGNLFCFDAGTWDIAKRWVVSGGDSKKEGAELIHPKPSLSTI